MRKILISNIQEFSLHDGPGIRTTVFFKGCAIHCPWCANPENIMGKRQWIFDKTKCICRGGCCVVNEQCNVIKAQLSTGTIARDEEAERCDVKALRIIGKYYSSEELFQLIMQDYEFWGTEGGVTFSGGEPFLQLVLCKEILRALKQNGVNIAVETSLFVTEDKMAAILQYIDLLYIDFKILNEEKCLQILGGDLSQFKKNFEYIRQCKKKYIARIPMVNGITTDKENLDKLIIMVQEYLPLKIEIFSVHNLAAEKYARLGKEYKSFSEVGVERLKETERYLQNIVPVEVEILQI